MSAKSNTSTEPSAPPPSNGPLIAFMQPFGLGSEGGGSRILRSLLQRAPVPVISIVTGPEPFVRQSSITEIYIPSRPYFGRLERTRIGWIFDKTAIILRTRFRKRLEDACAKNRVSAIHIVTHGIEWLRGIEVAKALQIPYFLSIHDDLEYFLRGKHAGKSELHAFAEAWQGASARFVISPELGDLYCKRYGHAHYVIITDGLSEVPTQTLTPKPLKLRVYFMGLVHWSYRKNFEILLDVLGELAISNPACETSLTVRSGWFPSLPTHPGVRVTILPFASHEKVLEDIESADLLYLPLPFDSSEALFTRYSLSTKMVTYLGSGVPILYHGPADAAAYRLLSGEAAAHCVTSQEPAEMKMALLAPPIANQKIAEAALGLAKERFMIHEIAGRFWKSLSSPCESMQ